MKIDNNGQLLTVLSVEESSDRLCLFINTEEAGKVAIPALDNFDVFKLVYEAVKAGLVQLIPYKEAPDVYRLNRASEYPAIGDQLDAIMKWLATETEFTVPKELKGLAMKCMSVKAKYPKPTTEGE